MRQRRFDQVFRNMHTTARKVYAAVPINEEWSLGAICSELKRIDTPMSKEVVLGCLRNLRDHSLVKAPNDFGPYRRTPVEPDLEPEPKEQPVVTPTLLKPVSTLASFTVLSDHARRMAASLNALADDIDALAIHMDDKLANSSRGAEKLQQLREVLKEIAQ